MAKKNKIYGWKGKTTEGRASHYYIVPLKVTDKNGKKVNAYGLRTVVITENPELFIGMNIIAHRGSEFILEKFVVFLPDTWLMVASGLSFFYGETFNIDRLTENALKKERKCH